MCVADCSSGDGELAALGPAYDKWRSSEVGRITDRLERQLVLELVGEVSGRRVLDVGCGDGELAVELAKRGATVAGIDTSAAMIAAAKKRARRDNLDIAFQVATAEELPFPSEQFDVVTAITILCFVENPAPVFREAARVMRPGGRFVIGELGKWSAWSASRRLRAWLGSRLWRQARFRTASELRASAKKAGLAIESVRGAIFYPRSVVAARLLGPVDRYFGRLTTFGAAFIAVTAIKPVK
ncbi:MAG: class I SAM-dependent methyltransferase [Hyphomicrobiales bacterium]